ncbi:uncharacterized protein LOC112552470 [Pogonomyrmex barbatus]|uniref:Uncharacterized protein LOC112552470 n=1 Tax=Pogonomyrmex barbatus TaxID=144034 RepID=A0A8N1S3S1_9HYME|nr:uncharacterized protein LOC112552470 [Pogonomyrmex barbatus]
MQRNDWQQVAQGFLNQWNFPSLGAVGGKHIRIQAPPRTGSLYYNYKTFLSIVLMAACDANYKFTWIDVGNYVAFLMTEYGQTPTSVVAWREGKNQRQREEEEENEMNEEDYDRDVRELGLREIIFNYRLSRARRVIENAFGILVSKWIILKGSIACSLESVRQLVKQLALVVLHNFLLSSEK